MIRKTRLAPVGLVLLLASIAGSCEKSQLLAPKDSTMTLTASPSSVVFDASDTTPVRVALTAQIAVTGGYPQPGVAVTFSTTAGVLASGGRAIETDPNNIAPDQLTVPSDAPAEITVTATSGSLSQTVKITKTTGGLAPTDGTIQVAANPASLVIDPDAGETSKSTEITAQVFDHQGRQLPNIAVRFRTTAGTLADTTPVLTDQLGIATTSLTMTTTDPDKADVTGQSSSLYATVNVTKNTLATNKPPVAAITASPANGADVGKQVTFDGTSSQDPDGQIVMYKWTITSDGTCCKPSPPYPPSPESCRCSKASPTEWAYTNIYDEAQTLSVTLQVTDNKGATDARVLVYPISCANPAPVANAGADQSVPGTAGNPVNVVLNGSATTDDKPIGITADHYHWDCGNGTVAQPVIGGDFRQVICRYTATPAINTWTAVLTVFDNGATGDLVNGVYPCQKSATDNATIKVVIPTE